MNDLDSLKLELEVERTNYLRNAEELVRQRDEARSNSATLEAKVADLLAALNEESVRKSEAVMQVVEVTAERDAAIEEAAKYQRLAGSKHMDVAELAASRDNWKHLQEETARFRAEWQARAEKAERDLGECLAATNEVLQEALTQGKEADAPSQALVKAVRAAHRLGAEEMRKKAVRAVGRAGVTAVYDGEDAWAMAKRVMQHLESLPLPGDEVKT